MPDFLEVASISEVLDLFGKFYKSLGLTVVLAAVFALGFHILQGFALNRMSKGLNIERGWLSFVPIANMYILGLVAEKYLIGDKKPPKYSKILYWLLIIEVFLCLIFLILTLSFMILMLKNIESAVNDNLPLTADKFSNFIPVIVVYFILLAVSIVYKVYKSIALWRIYSMYVKNEKFAVMYLILSIIFGFTAPLLLFSVSRHTPVFKDSQEDALFNIEGEE